MSSKKAVLAYSGGLDTTYCAVWLREQGYAVHAVTVQTGGFDEGELARIRTVAEEAGVAEHVVIDACPELYDRYLRYLIYGNVLRGDVYPLCVSAERAEQARRCALYAAEIGADAVVHGSTGAGNDQFRFDTAFRVYAPGVAVLTPIRAQALSREDETAYLAGHGIEIPPKTTRYSINQGLWGVTIGGGETHRSDGVLPEDAWVLTAPPGARPPTPEQITLTFERGVPTAIDGTALDPVALIEMLNRRAGVHGVGRGVHVGDTIVGIKGRVAFEAPAAVTLIAAHRELEKLVLSRQQQFWKRTLGELYGTMLHEARIFDPLARDIEAFLASSQARVSGAVQLQWHAGQCVVLGATSDWSLLGAHGATYGEGSTSWDGGEAAAFAKLYGLHDVLLHAAGRGADHATVA